MESDRQRWDRKYGPEGMGRELAPVDSFVQSALAALDALDARGRALDLASGAGRHALELARRGWSAHAWDVSPVGLERLASHASEAQLEVSARALDVEAGQAWPDGPFELVLVANFLLSRVRRPVAELVAPGGHLIYTTFTQDWPGEKPPPAFRLRAGELAAGLPGFTTVLHEEHEGRAGLLARRADD